MDAEPGKVGVWFNKKNRSRPAFSRNIDLEQLENRLTPTTITNVGGLILIFGSNGPLLPDDNLTISIANNQLTVTEANTTLTGTVFGIAAVVNDNNFLLILFF